MPLVFPRALGLRTWASLGAISLFICEAGSSCIPDRVVLGVQGALPTQILPRNVLMSGPCVSCQHMLCGDTLLPSELHISAWVFLSGSTAWRLGLPSVPMGEETGQMPEHLNTAMLHGIRDFFPPFAPNSRAVCAADLRVTMPLSSSFNAITLQSQQYSQGDGCSCPRGICVNFSWERSRLGCFAIFVPT